MILKSEELFIIIKFVFVNFNKEEKERMIYMLYGFLVIIVILMGLVGVEFYKEIEELKYINEKLDQEKVKF